ncbi:acyl carrier protein [Spartinivicinus poritis]|uniref:Acyl carrier protein n=1 Tax=Spartinivicinus poritis TaxID=2994640 RepID=A0ABT5UIW1_9GAMM|nr:acyl carrier protein [Spartinivicinus sp. A2-2]MDE1464984.1 acyl carrier protein [Spartinivicinus sp. A2-2]
MELLVMDVINDVKQILVSQLQLGDQLSAANEATPLLGAIPEFDSMAVVTVITALEEQFGFVVDDDEISAEVFESLGSLCEFVQAKA